ncbi:MAG: cadherin repeat domain-containing protein, partial [Betaproteobacteria bacterium]|nr:cadherin repeat domain-containing protein [Betaproteobacteria bacterium]
MPLLEQPITSAHPANKGDGGGAGDGSCGGDALINKKEIHLVSGNDQNIFSISSSGQLFVSNTLNLVFETTQSYNLTVRVKDSGKPESAQAALEKTTSVNITVLPVNFPPTIIGDAFTIAENSASGSTVMKGA